MVHWLQLYYNRCQFNTERACSTKKDVDFGEFAGHSLLESDILFSLHICQRLSVMHEPAGVVENLVQNSTVYPYSAIQNTSPPPPRK